MVMVLIIKKVGRDKASETGIACLFKGLRVRINKETTSVNEDVIEPVQL